MSRSVAVNPQDSEQNLRSPKFMMIGLQEGMCFFDTFQFGVQIDLHAPSDENYRCKGCSGQGVEEARDNSSMGFGKSQEEKGGYLGSTERDMKRVHFASLMDFSHLRNAELDPKLLKYKAESCSVVTLYKTTQVRTQVLLNKALLCPR